MAVCTWLMQKKRLHRQDSCTGASRFQAAQLMLTAAAAAAHLALQTRPAHLFRCSSGQAAWAGGLGRRRCEACRLREGRAEAAGSGRVAVTRAVRG